MSIVNRILKVPGLIIVVLLMLVDSIFINIGLDPYKNFPTPDYPEGTINHSYSKLINGYENWYGLTSMQGILNMINEKDKDGIISRFSENAKNANNLSEQIDILFDYFDGEILDFENDHCTGGSSVEYGHYHYYYVYPYADTKTKNYYYHISMKITLMNDDEGEIGINSISVIRKDIAEPYSKLHKDIPWDTDRAIDCIGINGLIT